MSTTEGLLSGYVDLSRIVHWCSEDLSKYLITAGDEASLRGPGFAVSYRTPGCDVLIRDGALVLVCGAPDTVGGAADGGNAARWFEAYNRHGATVPIHLRGHHCAVCIDSRQKRVLLVTDRFAVWPMCYRTYGGQLFFADRADRLPLPFTPVLSPESLFDYFYFHAIPAPRTVFRDVSRLEAACVLTFDQRGSTVARYWIPEFQERQSASPTELREEFLVLLRRAVAAELGSGGIGCFLSGGTDSSTVAGLAAELTGGRAKTYSIGFDTDGYDETAYARLAARHFGTEHHEHYVTPVEIVEALPTLAASFDQPFGNSSALPAYSCARQAGADEVPKMLAGDGGDELFGGNARYVKQRLFDLYRLVPGVIRTGLIEPVVDRRIASAIPVVKKAASYVRQARVPMPERLETYNLVMRLGAEHLFTRDFLALSDPQAPARQQREVYHSSGAASLINRMLCYDWKYTLADNDLVKVRSATRLAGLAVGFPMLHQELVEFSLRLAPASKVKGVKLRYFFKQALKGFLPPEILAKKKHGFGMPFGPWLIRSSALRAMAEDALASLQPRNLIRHELTTDLFSTKLPTHAGYYGELIWLLVTLEHWLRVHYPDFRVEAAATPVRATACIP
jgi:asparagine synthase (glutamine-hydrolysing)